MSKKVLSALVCLTIFASMNSFIGTAEAAARKHFSLAQINALLPTVTVTTTADSGAGSLRAALTAANETAGTTIQFNIPTSDSGYNGKVFTIRVAGPLPTITKDVTIIDAATQTAATGNTNPAGPEVVLDGRTAAINTDGLTLNSNSNQVRGLVINNFFGGAGVVINGPAKSNVVAGCFIGTDEAGVASAGNRVGVRISGGATINVIGGSVAEGNLISGNNTDGIVITGAGTDGNIVAGNIIGLDATASRNQLPNLGDGISVSGGAKANIIGGTAAELTNAIGGNLRNGLLITGEGTSGNTVQGNLIGTIGSNIARGNGQAGIAITSGADTTMVGGVNGGNIIAFNATNGISVGSANASAVAKNTISRNAIFSNGRLGIDLGSDGVTKNDAGDADNGPNGLLNYPIITSVNAADGKVTITGTVDLTAPDKATVEVFANSLPSPGQDISGFGEGQSYMASATPNVSGEFTATVTTSANITVTATVTDAAGNTSEFSPVFQLGGGQPDMQVTDLTSSVSSITAGGTVRLTFNIQNKGNAAASSARHDVVLSADNTLNGQDLVLTSVNTSALPPNTSQAFTADVKIPADGLSGALFIGVIADAGSAITESVEANNTANLALTVTLLPDLLVSNLALSKTTVNPGDSLRVEFAVTNRGSSNAPAHTQEVRLSADNIIDANDTLLTTLASTGINAGTTTQFVIDVQLPQGLAPGQLFVGVVADGGKSIAEADEANNTATAAVAISGQIDFAVSELTANPAVSLPGGQVALSFKLNNLGSLPAPATGLEVRLSNNQSVDGNDLLLGTLASTAIAANGSQALTFTATLPANLPSGAMFIGVIADARKEVAEANEANNTGVAAITVSDASAPRVTVESPNGAETVASGSTFTIKWTAVDDISVTTQDIFLSTDGGSSFNQVIASGLPGTANTFVWNVASTLSTGSARIQIVARDAQGNVGRDISDQNFAIGLRPAVINPVYSEGKLKLNSVNANILPGATLIIINGSQRESFALSTSTSGKFIVKKNEASQPSGLKLRQAIPKGATVQLVVRNSNGIESAPVNFQR